MPVDKASGSTKGFGFVTFTSPKAAEDAISIVNGTTILDKYKVHAETYKRKKKPQHPRKKPQPHNPTSTKLGQGVIDVYVGSDIPNHIKNDHIRAHFKDYEAFIANAMVVRDPQTKKTKGYAIVTFSSVDAAHDAIQKLNGSLLHGIFPLVLEEAQKHSINNVVSMVTTPADGQVPPAVSSQTSASIIISNLPSSVSEESIGLLLGGIQHKSCHIDSEASKAVLELFSVDDARAAVSKLDGITLLGQVINVSDGKPPGPGKQRGGKPRSAKGEVGKCSTVYVYLFCLLDSRPNIIQEDKVLIHHCLEQDHKGHLMEDHLMEDHTHLMEDHTHLMLGRTHLMEDHTHLMEDHTHLMEDHKGHLMEDNNLKCRETISKINVP